MNLVFEVNEATKAKLLTYQRTEETDHLIYSRIAKRQKNEENRRILTKIAADEKAHAEMWACFTGRQVGPDRLRAAWYVFLSWLLGYTFILKLLERREYVADAAYRAMAEDFPEVQSIIHDEESHERQLAAMLDEERLRYVGAVVLGLNDALVELSGTIAGLTLALADTRVVAMAGIITGVSATLSMAASNYLAERAEGRPDALKSSCYTGAAYLVTVVCLVAPYLLLPREMYMAALGTMMAVVILIIFCFNYYISVAKSVPFGRRFGEMACISLGVAAISFVIGLLAKNLLGVDI